MSTATANKAGPAKAAPATEHVIVGDLVDPITLRYDPWVHLGLGDPAELFGGVTVAFKDLPNGQWGLTTFATRRIELTRGLTAHEVRSTLAHELVHLERGPVYGVEGGPEHLYDEAICDLIAASRLIPLDELPGLCARVDAEGIGPVAESLEVDGDTVQAGMDLARAIAGRVARSADRKE